MRKYICDNCGKEVEFKNDLHETDVSFKLMGFFEMHILWGKEYCDACAKKIADLVEPVLNKLDKEIKEGVQ